MKSIILSFIFIFIGTFAFSQATDSIKLVSIVGRITNAESGSILSGVKITNESRNNAQISKSNGFYSIVAAQGDIIRFTHIGYEPMYMRINETADSKETVMVTMRESMNEIDTVIVDKPSLSELNDYFMAMDVEADADRELAEQNDDTFLILDEIDEPGPRGPVSFVSGIINDKIKKKMKKKKRHKDLPKHKSNSSN